MNEFNEDKPDISIIYLCKENTSMTKCIEYAKERNITCEIIQEIKDAKGDYLTVCHKDVYYSPNYLHTSYIGLQFRNKQKDCFIYRYMVVFDKNDNSFFVSKNNRYDLWRRGSETRNKMVEKELFGKCVLDQGYIMEKILPPNDNYLWSCGNFFNSL